MEMNKKVRHQGYQFDNSFSLFERAVNLVPGQSQTFSKSWTQYPFGAAPIFAARAEGGHVWDVDQNCYIDWPMALGPLLLGHNYPTVVEAVQKQLENGIAYSLPHEKEIELAEKLINWFPYAEMVRFGKNGSDATTGAVRVARAFTGKDIVLCSGYHGWHDWFIGTTTRSAGVPQGTKDLTIPFSYNNISELENLLNLNKGSVAAIIMEPMGVDLPTDNFLQNVRLLADQFGVVLIFDECWTGFRIHSQGAFGKFGVTPDLACFGKALGNGVPISVVLGRSDIMSVFEEVFYSFTFGGDMLGIQAAIAVLDVLSNEPVLEHIDKIGSELITGMQTLIDQYGLSNNIDVTGYPGRHIINFHIDGYEDLKAKTLFQQEAIKKGILAASWHAPSFGHTEADVTYTLEVYDSVFKQIKVGLDDNSLASMLVGKEVQPVFRKP